MLTWQEFLGGWIGGIITISGYLVYFEIPTYIFEGMAAISTSHPLDTLKVRHQHSHQSLSTAVKSTFRHEGLHGFYKGMAFPVLASGLQNSVYFGMYANLLRYTLHKKNLPENGDKITGMPVFMAGCYATMVQVLITNPVEIIKIKLQTRTGVRKLGGAVETPHRTMWTCIHGTYLTQGIRGFYYGIVPTVLRDVPTGGLYILTYVNVDSWLMQKNIGEYFSHMLAGGFAGVVSNGIVNPFDVVKTRLQADNPECPKYDGTIDCIKKSYRQHGMSVFWRGFTLSCSRAFVSNSVVFAMYELCLKLFYIEIKK